VPGGLGAAGHVQEPQRSFLLEVENARGRGLDAADPPAEFGNLCTDDRFGEHAQAERQRRRGYVVTALDRQGKRDRIQVRLTELAVRYGGGGRPPRRRGGQRLAGR
jgi:hypothetical protein